MIGNIWPYPEVQGIGSPEEKPFNLYHTQCGLGCADSYLCKYPELFIISFATNGLMAQSLPTFPLIQSHLS